MGGVAAGSAELQRPLRALLRALGRVEGGEGGVEPGRPQGQGGGGEGVEGTREGSGVRGNGGKGVEGYPGGTREGSGVRGDGGKGVEGYPGGTREGSGVSRGNGWGVDYGVATYLSSRAVSVATTRNMEDTVTAMVEMRMGRGRGVLGVSRKGVKEVGGEKEDRVKDEDAEEETVLSGKRRGVAAGKEDGDSVGTKKVSGKKAASVAKSPRSSRSSIRESAKSASQRSSLRKGSQEIGPRRKGEQSFSSAASPMSTHSMSMRSSRKGATACEEVFVSSQRSTRKGR